MGGKTIGIAESEMTFDSVTTASLNVTGTQTVATQAVTALTVTTMSTTGTATLGTLAVTASAQIGNATTDTVGFYGATVTTQPTAISAVTTATLTSVTTEATISTTPFGYSTAAQADAIVATLNAVAVRAAALTTQGNAMDSALTTLGLVA